MSQRRYWKWLVILAVLAGLFVGVGGYTFYYAKGISYLSNDPAACVNCHIMRDQFDGWAKSSHHAVAVCNDCHVPHSLIPKYATKAEHGWRHSVAFTFQNFHEPIQMKESSLLVVENNCVRCHSAVANNVLADCGAASQKLSCLQCHEQIAHGPVR